MPHLETDTTIYGLKLISLASAEDSRRASKFIQFYDVNKPKMATKMLTKSGKEATEIHYLTPKLKYQGTRDEVIGELVPEEIRAILPLVKKEGKLDATGDEIENAVPPPTAKSKERVATQQHHRSHAKVDSILKLTTDSEVNANPEYKSQISQPPITRQEVNAACKTFAVPVKINYLVNSSGVINRSHASGYPSSGFDDFCEFNRKFTEIAQVDDQYANMVEANFILKDKQAQSDFYGFQQQSHSEGSPNPLHELSCQRLGLDLDCPPHDSDGRSYQFPSILTVKAAKLESVESGMVRLHRWRVQAVVWLIHMERSHLSAGLLADDMGLDETTSATCLHSAYPVV